MANTDCLIDVYEQVKECDYKGEHYSVRDNGAIMRHPKNGHVRPKDNKWTFGKKDNNTGYMFFASNIRVHQIVATAFHGTPDDGQMVVDHKNTNRCDNRPENLQWITRLENVLNNPYTIKYCGSVENFLNNPSTLRVSAKDSDFRWMRTVSKEEAAKCQKHLDRWLKEDNDSSHHKKGIGEWIFNNEPKDDSFGEESWDKDWVSRNYESGYMRKGELDFEFYEKEYGLKQSLTSNALQLNWKTPSSFPLCPKIISEQPLNDYLSNLSTGEVFSSNQYGSESVVVKYGISKDGQTLAVICTNETVKGVPGYVLASVRFENNKFIHMNEGSFFHEDGAEKYFTIALGEEWTGGEVFDDYC